MEKKNAYTGIPSKKNLSYNKQAWSIIYPNYWNMKTMDNKKGYSNLNFYPPSASSRILNKSTSRYIDDVEKNCPELIPKPTFLQILMNHINSELEVKKCPPSGHHIGRHQIYNETFQWLIEGFVSYKTILASIKREYDVLIRFYKDVYFGLRPLKDAEVLIEMDGQHRFIKHFNDEITLKKDLKMEIRATLTVIWAKSTDLKNLKSQISKMREEIEKSDFKYREGAHDRKQLITSIRLLKDSIQLLAEEHRVRLVNPDLGDNAQIIKQGFEIQKRKICELTQEMINLVFDYIETEPLVYYEHLENQITMESTDQIQMEESLRILKDSTASELKKRNAITKSKNRYKKTYFKMLTAQPKVEAVKLLRLFVMIETLSRNNLVTPNGTSRSWTCEEVVEDLLAYSNSVQTDNTQSPPAVNTAVMTGISECIFKLPQGTLKDEFELIDKLLVFPQDRDEDKSHTQHTTKRGTTIRGAKPYSP